MSTPLSRGFAAYLDGLANFGIEPSLTGIKALCRRLGDPQTAFKAIQITGTNGKTTTARMVQALLITHGVKTGLYTSPHLSSYLERILIGNAEIGTVEFELIGQAVRSAAAAVEREPGGRRITQFEAITAAALLAFSRSAIDTAVLEVGMGARWDATSVASAEIGVVTNVSLDHADWLGPTVEHIAAEKAYVLSAGGVGVIGPVSSSVAAIFAKRAEGRQARLISFGTDFFLTGEEAGFFAIKTPLGLYERIELGPSGPWQRENAAVAVAAAEARLGGPLDIDLVRETLADLRSPGRAEFFPGRPGVLIDGAHNLDGIEALTSFIRQDYAGRPVVVVASILRDKSAQAMVRKLEEAAAGFIFTVSDNPRCLPAGELAAMVSPGFSVALENDPSAALATAKQAAAPDGLVVVTGSLYLVGLLRATLSAATREL